MRHCSETLGLNLAAVFQKAVRFSDIAVLIAGLMKNGQFIFQVNLAYERTEKSKFEAKPF